MLWLAYRMILRLTHLRPGKELEGSTVHCHAPELQPLLISHVKLEDVVDQREEGIGTTHIAPMLHRRLAY